MSIRIRSPGMKIVPAKQCLEANIAKAMTVLWELYKCKPIWHLWQVR